MGFQKKTIDLSDEQAQFVQARMEQGGYKSASEYFRDLIRRGQERNEADIALKDTDLEKGY